jgi:hypothetical protein
MLYGASLAEVTPSRKKRGEGNGGCDGKNLDWSSMRIGWPFVIREYLLDNGLIEE